MASLYIGVFENKLSHLVPFTKGMVLYTDGTNQLYS